MSIFPDYILSAVINGFLTTCITFIVFLLNVSTKSSNVTIVSAVVIIVVIYQKSSSVAFIGNELIIYGILAAIGIICSIVTIRKIKTMDF